MAQTNGGLSREQQNELYRTAVNKTAKADKQSGRLNDVIVSKPKKRRVYEPPVSAAVPEKTDVKRTARQSDNTEKISAEKPAAKAKQRKASIGDIAAEKKDKAIRSLLSRPKCPDAPAVECTWLKKRGRFDMPLFTVVLILLVMGIVMMSSASYAYSLAEQSDSFVYMEQQLQGAIIGFVALCFASKLDYHAYIKPWKRKSKKKYAAENGNGLNAAKVAFVFSCVLMIAVYFFGEAVNDAKRWITIFGVQFQPSELLKIAAILLVAYMLQRYYEQRRDIWYGFLKYWLVLIPACVFCLMQRHVSAMLIIFAIIYVMMFVGGSHRGGMISLIVLAVVALAMLLFVFKWDYLTERLQSFFEPFSATQDSTYQTSQSLITIGSGGWFGLGLGNSRQKYFYLPESQNDFVFSIICEELGFVGAMTVILLFVLFECRGFLIAAKAKDKFGSFVALGITLQIGIQALLNIGVACNAIPNTGISLPFFSYGRTALIIQMFEVGILLSVSKQSDT